MSMSEIYVGLAVILVFAACFFSAKNIFRHLKPKTTLLVGLIALITVFLIWIFLAWATKEPRAPTKEPPTQEQFRDYST
jgi:hypothetical protein